MKREVSSEEAIEILLHGNFAERSALVEVAPREMMEDVRFVAALHTNEDWNSLTRHWLRNPAIPASAAQLSFDIVLSMLGKEHERRMGTQLLDIAEWIWHLSEMERRGAVGGAKLSALSKKIREAMGDVFGGRSLRYAALLLRLQSLEENEQDLLMEYAEGGRNRLFQLSVANHLGVKAVLTVMRHEKVSLEFLREAADFSPLHPSWEEMLEIPRLVNDEVAFKMLVKNSYEREMSVMATRFEGKKLGTVLLTLAQRSAPFAATSIGLLSDVQRESLPKEVWTELLSMPDAELRLAAMLAYKSAAMNTEERRETDESPAVEKKEERRTSVRRS